MCRCTSQGSLDQCEDKEIIQGVAVCSSVLQCVAVCCSVLRSVAVSGSVWHCEDKKMIQSRCGVYHIYICVYVKNVR